jgi:D-alanyl-D-alanine carboxypeptidase-like protein
VARVNLTMSLNQVNYPVGHPGGVRFLLALAATLTLLAACTTPAEQAKPTADDPSQPTTPAPTAAPTWQVGARPLPLRPDGYGQVLPTPPELVNRGLPTKDVLPPPKDGRYAATVEAVPDDVLARSTYRAGCPTSAAELRYLTMSFWGFDGRPHTGEMIVNGSVAKDVTMVFRLLYEARFPIEEMRVTTAAELTAPPTGDGNNTAGFVCRDVTASTGWSAHAYGFAIDLDPFCNPYVKGDLVLPELASSYVDRSNVRPGMVQPGDVAVRAFAAIGWDWGGEWTDPRDIQHFTATGH